MQIGGFQKVSLIDYPGQISAVVFTQGCNFRCAYCHNAELVNPEQYGDLLDPEMVLAHLSRRRGKLDAVTLTGGEPTLQKDLGAFIRDVRYMHYLVKLDTNGSRPEILKSLIDAGVLDYVAMDVKTSLKQYPAVTHSDIDPGNIRKSIDMIMASGIHYEFRTTVLPAVTTPVDLLALARDIKDARRYVLQGFIPSKTLDQALLGQKTFTREEMQDIKEKLTKYLPCIIIRS